MSTFQPGDTVRCVDATGCTFLQLGKIYTVDSISMGGFVEIVRDDLAGGWLPSRFERIGNAPKPSQARNPHGALGFGDEPARLDPAQIDQAREMVGTIRALIRTATEMGLAAGLVRVGLGSNPFNDRFPDYRLAEAWSSGWRVGNDGAHT